MATTYDFDITRNAELAEAIARLDAQANDRVYALIYQSGNLVLTRRNANYFGSEKELTVQNGVGYTLLMAPDESDKFTAGVAATYKMYLVDADGVPTEIINGTITVEPRAGESAPAYVVEQRASLHVTGTEMPDAGDYAEGTIATWDGVVKVVKDGEWEMVTRPFSYISIYCETGSTPVITNMAGIPLEYNASSTSTNIYLQFAEGSLESRGLTQVIGKSMPFIDITPTLYILVIEANNIDGAIINVKTILSSTLAEAEIAEGAMYLLLEYV